MHCRGQPACLPRRLDQRGLARHACCHLADQDNDPDSQRGAANSLVAQRMPDSHPTAHHSAYVPPLDPQLLMFLGCIQLLPSAARSL